MTPSQTVFLALDPILKMLLSSIESYREACTTDTTVNEERILGKLGIQVRLLENLERAIKETVNKHGAGVLQGLLDYILLPLRLVLQSSGWSDNANEPIRQSAVWKTTETAARVLDCTLSLAGNSSTTLKQTLDCLSACTFPLPMEQIASKGLDRGDDCLYAVLHCIDTLLEQAHGQKTQISMEMEGNLVARISFACTILLSPDHKSSRKTRPQVQLQALDTIDLLMKVVPDPEMWQSYFPGLFAVLYGLVLSDLRLAPAQASPKVSAHSCCTLSRLLSVTLSTENKRVEHDIDAWTRIERIAAHHGTVQENDSAFLKEVYSRLPAPLILLLNLLPAASSPKLRQTASELCHSIVVETHSVWDKDETLNVLRSGIECCIALSRDKDERVASAAKRTIIDYRHDSGKQQVDNTIGPRLLELIEELPALARSRRETELRGKINLISGYLSLGESLRSSLTSVDKEIQSSLAVLFDVDFDSIQYAPRVESADAWNIWQPDQCRFRFMMDATAMLAREMIRLLGNALGQKGASLFVDACVANVLEACMATSHTLFGPRQVEWLHEWIGFIIIANEILVGAFDEQHSSSEKDGMPRSSQKEETLNRRSRKRIRKLHALAGAILPVITSDPLWTLPTVLDNVNKERIDETESHGSLTVIEIQDEVEVQAETVSASALKGNAALVCSLIGLVNEMVNLLANDSESFLLIVLYPLCERASSQNHSQVQRTAALALHRYAMACRLESTRELIRQNFDYLFGAMLSKTRRPQGHLVGCRSSFPGSISSIMQAVLRSATDVKTSTNFVRSLSDETCISFVIELANALVASFDSNLAILNNDPLLQAFTTMDLVEVFDASLSFIASTFGLNLDRSGGLSAEVEIPAPNNDWMATLKPFRLCSSLDRDDLTAKEGFEKFRDENGDKDENNDNETHKVNSPHPSIEITDSELDFVSLVLSRCSFFLSSPALHVEMASCVGMQHAFEFLGLIAKYSQPKEDDEPNGPQTAILRHIAVSFPSIISRIRSLSSTVVAATSIRRVSIRMLQVHGTMESSDISTEMIFLSKLCDLVGCMTQVSGSFLVDRIRQQVWPIIAEFLDVYVQLEKETSHKQLGIDNHVSNELAQKKAVATEREKLLYSILDFLSRIYGQQECGKGLADLIPAAGTIILPFLANQGELRDRTMRALKTMMLIDCDALWRPLLQLSNRPLPPRPFGHEDTCIAVVNPGQECTTPLELAAAEIVAFVEALPEQTLDIL